MKTIHELKNEIESTITIVKTKYPELVKYLDEMTITIPKENIPEINSKLLTEYLQSLENMIEKYAVNHK